jgi:hypothetical protein
MSRLRVITLITKRGFIISSLLSETIGKVDKGLVDREGVAQFK